MPYLRYQPTFHAFTLLSLGSGCKRIDPFREGCCAFGLIDDPEMKGP